MPRATTRSTRESRESRPVQVAEAIKSWVMEQGLKSGDRLPGESDLIARFQRSKGTIREAMRILEAQGLVRTRTGPGGGAFVAEMSDERARAMLSNYVYFQGLTIEDIYQLRRVLEPEMAADLAGRLAEDDIAGLEAIMAAYATPALTPGEERAQHVASLEFHRRLAELSGNRLLGLIVGFVAAALSDLTVYRQLYDPPNRTLWEQGRGYQTRLIAAFRARDPVAARQAMAAHMDMAERLMTEQQAHVLRRFMRPDP